MTLPVLYTYKHAEEQVRAQIRDVYTLPGLDQRAAKLRDVCDLGPGVAYAEARAEELIRSARERVETLAPSRARHSLESLCGFILSRRF